MRGRPNKGSTQKNSALEIINKHALTVQLYNASLDNDAQTIRHLLSVKVDPNSGAANPAGDTPLIVASLRGNLEAAQALLDGGANLEMTNQYGATALHVATKNSQEKMVTLLLSRDAKVDAGINEGNLTALYLAAQSNHTGIASLLLKSGAGANRAHHKLGDSALHVAAQEGFYELAALLLQYQADPNARMNVEGYTPLDNAVQNNHPKLVQLLLANHANPNLKNLVDGGTPLHFAVEKNYIAVANLLVRGGANLKATNQTGLTPLHILAGKNNLVLAELLLKKDASIVSLKSHMAGHTPLQAALDKNHLAMASLLIRYGATLADLYCPADSKLLNLYISRGDIVKTQWLLSHGASLDEKCDKHGYYPMTVAHLVDSTEMLNVLIRHQSQVLHSRMVEMACDDSHPLGQGLNLVRSMFLPAHNPHTDLDIQTPTLKK